MILARTAAVVIRGYGSSPLAWPTVCCDSKGAAMRRVVVTGAGGFIGSHLVSFLKARGEWVRGVDIKAPEFGPTDADDF